MEMVKRMFDIIFSVFGLILCSPVLTGISIVIKKEDSGPVFYRGIRVGRYGKPFRIFKFRTMVVDAEKIGASSTAEDDPRITKIGKWIRKYKLDELPQLLNVLKGEMSFVGPRPQVPWAVELYNEKEKRILDVRPGITDYASIKFRNEAEILKNSKDPDKTYLEKIAPEKLKLSLKYLENMSLWNDIKIIFTTIRAVFQKTA